MLRSPFPGHRRYSITHRAVQRLRELVPAVGEEDDEALRDRLDAAITTAEDAGKAVRTLDVMLAEPQILIPLESFGDTLYAIIKEDTVVTVLPRGHGEEILQRGQALEQRVAAGEPPVRTAEREDAWELTRRRWRRDAPTPVVERVRGPGVGPGDDTYGDEPVAAAPTPILAPAAPPPSLAPRSPASEPAEDPAEGAAGGPAKLRARRLLAGAGGSSIVTSGGSPERKKLSPVAEALARGLALAKRRAAAHALHDALRHQPPEAPLQPLWDLLAEKNLPESLTIGDLVAAVRGLPG